MARKNQKLSREAVEFQPDAVELSERPLPPQARWALYLMALFLVSAVVWASLARTDKIVMARGKLATVNPPVVVRPLSTSTLRSLEVHIGDKVAKGQALASLDPTISLADMGQVKKKITYLNAWIDRLEAEVRNRPYRDRPDADYGHHALQLQLFRQNKEEYLANLESFQRRTNAVQARLEANAKELERSRSALKKAGQIASMRRELYRTKDGSRLAMLESELRSQSLAAEMERLAGTQQELSHELERIKAERIAFINSWRTDLGEKLVQAWNQRELLVEQMAKASYINRLEVLRAPISGVVMDLGNYSVGSVVKQGEALVSLVPSNERLLAEAEVSTSDIGYLKGHDRVRIKVDAYPFQRHGTLDGEVATLSPDAFSQGGASGKRFFYRARITLSDSWKQNPKIPALIPGMTLMAEIKVGQRRMINYFLDPILKALDESIKEP